MRNTDSHGNCWESFKCRGDLQKAGHVPRLRLGMRLYRKSSTTNLFKAHPQTTLVSIYCKVPLEEQKESDELHAHGMAGWDLKLQRLFLRLIFHMKEAAGRVKGKEYELNCVSFPSGPQAGFRYWRGC